MADLRNSGDDDALPPPQQHQHDAPISLVDDDLQPAELDGETNAAENGSDGKQSGEGRDSGPSEQGPPTTAPASVPDEQSKPTVDPIVAKHVSDVMSSEVRFPDPHWPQWWLSLSANYKAN